MKIKKIIIMTSAIAALGSAVTPTTAVFASQIENETSYQENQGYLLDENNTQFMSIVNGIRESGYTNLSDDLFSFFNGKVVTSENKDKLVLEFEEYYSRRPQIKVATTTVLATIASAMAVTKGMYEAGKYAAKQLDTRGMLTKAEYKPNGGWWMAGIAVAFGIPASLGFDDYMYNR